jgi:hypothetical protein
MHFYSFKESPIELLFPSIILITLSIPVGKIELPLELRPFSIKVWYPAGLVITGILAIAVIFLNPEIGTFLTVIYGIGLLIFTWVGSSW